MNIPKLFEYAIARTLQEHAEGELPRIRTWQNVSDDLQWIPTNDRCFPLIDIRCSPAKTGEDGVTQSANVALLVATNANDDQKHDVLAGYFEDVQTVIDSLYKQFINDTVGAERTTFNAAIADSQPDASALITIGGFEHGEPLTPYEDGGANFIGLNFIVHFSRSDY